MFDPAEQDRLLKEFLAKHVHPYDPETDDYDCPPFAADIKEGKNDPIYNAHSYHTKVPPRSIIPYILHYTRPGDLILDPFSGSGMTGVAAQMCANPPADILEQFPELKDRVGPRACILNDLSPAACHIAYNYNTPVDVDALKREFERIKEAVKEEFDWLYGTEHYEPAVGLYDLANAGVASRFKNPPAATAASSQRGQMVMEGHAGYGARDWELLTKAEVEARLGYPVTELPRGDSWDKLDVAEVTHWVCIPATIQYTIWSDVYRCEGFVTIEEPTGKVSKRGKNAGKPILRRKRVARGCGRDIVLWDAAMDKDTNKAAEVFSCPHCHEKWVKKQLTLLKPKAIVSDYEFVGLRMRRSQRVEVATLRTTRRFTAKESQLVSDLAWRQLPYWHPQDEVDNGREMLRHGLLKRGIQTISDFYTRRNLWAMARLWKEIESEPNKRVRQFLRFAFTSIVPYVSLKQSYGGGGGGLSSTLYIASLTSEKNVAEVFRRKADSLLKSLLSFNALASTTDACVVLGSADNLPVVDESVDYIFTDPPFGSNIYYADCSLLWETWLGRITDESKEMVVSDRRINGPFKTLEDYTRMMETAFGEMFRMLKPGRWATVEFSNSDGRVFNAIKQAVRSVGFEIVNMLVLEKTQKSFKQVKGVKGEEDVVDKDVLFNLYKPVVARSQTSAADHDLEHQVADAVRRHLQSLPERIKAEPGKYSDEHRATATIHIMLMNTLIPRGVDVQRLNLPFIERVCARYFRKVGQHWYLRGEAVGVNGGDLIQEEVAIKDELTAIAWLRQKLELRPALIGELKPLWMKATGLLPASVSQSLVLEDLLNSNFWRDEGTNRWREPTAAERNRMNDDKSIRILHDAERYVAGSLRRQTTDAERCGWIDTLFQMCRALEDNDAHVLPSIRDLAPDEGYRVIGRLFHGILRDRVPKDVYSRAAKQAAVASQRIVKDVGDKAEKAKAKRHKDEGPTLFDL